MQWEFTSPSDHHVSSSFTSTPTPTQTQADDSIRDVSMSINDDHKDEPSSSKSTKEDAVDGEINSQRQLTTTNSRPSQDSDDSDDDHDDSTIINQWPIPPMMGTVINYLVPPITQQQQQQHEQDQVAAAITPSSSRKAHTTLHPREKPLLILSYAQLIFNASLLLLVAFISFAVVYTVCLDVIERLREIEDAYHHSINTCKRSFQLNCLTVPVPPALVQSCEDWSACSRRKLTDALGGSRLRVVIEVLSEAWEAGVAGMGWRTLAFSLLLLTVFIGKANDTFNGLRLGAWKKSNKKQQQQKNCHHDQDEDEHDKVNRCSHASQKHQQSIGSPIPSPALIPPSPHQSYQWPPPAAQPYYYPQYPAIPRRSRRIMMGAGASPGNRSLRSKGLRSRMGTPAPAPTPAPTRDGEWVEMND